MASQPLDRILPPWLANPRNPAMSPISSPRGSWSFIQYLHVYSSTPGPLFLLSDGTPLNHQTLTSSIQSILSAAGVPGCYTGHSFCIGTTTCISAASYGLPDYLSKTLYSKWFWICIRSIYALPSLLP